MSAASKDTPSSMTDLTADFEQGQHADSESGSVSKVNPVVIGLYGVSGCGKTFLMGELKQKLGEDKFTFHDGSTMISTVTPGGLEAFKKMGEKDKTKYRQLAIKETGKNCVESGKAAVVAGHYMFWDNEDNASGEIICTEGDKETYTQIIYLDTPPKVIAQRRLGDTKSTKRVRPSISEKHLTKWQQEEKTQLSRLCREHKILFTVVSDSEEITLSEKVATLLGDFQVQNEEYNLTYATELLDGLRITSEGQPKTVLVMDADKTLAAEDAGLLLFKKLSTSLGTTFEDTTLKDLFGGPLGQTYLGFRQAALLFEERINDAKFDTLCKEVASEVTMHPEFVSLLRLVAQHEVRAVVVSCGLRGVWEKVLEREGLHNTVDVIAGGRIADGFVVTATVKCELVKHLRDTHDKRVFAFGDSPLDLGMLCEADEAIVVVGEEATRSKSMDEELKNAIDKGLKVRQVLLPSEATPRLDPTILPLTKLTDYQFIESVFGCHTHQTSLRFLQAKENASKLLASPTRDSAIAGPALRDYHRRIGWYLATDFLTDIIGLEECRIVHVYHGATSGYRLWHERQTTIVALMRGGEPMASGVNDAFPQAMFVHANQPDDIKLHHLQGQVTVLLVDSVVNTGKTMVEFIEHIRKVHATIRIVVVAGIVQAKICQDPLKSHSILVEKPSFHKTLDVVAFRVSETSYKGTRANDTGNRLFNTTHLP